METTHECTRCSKTFGPKEAEKVWQHFGTCYVQSDMCWRCADNYEPGDEYYERMPEVVAARDSAIYEAAKDAGRCK